MNKNIWAYVNESNRPVWTTGGFNGKTLAVFATRKEARVAKANVPTSAKLVKFTAN